MNETNHSPGIKFVKAEANGNDFLIVDAAAVAPAKRSAFARDICHRHLGIGADGVEFVESSGTSFDLALFNADGGEAELSGNGTRCVVAFYARHGFQSGVLNTAAGPLRALVRGGVRGEARGIWDIEIELGAPCIDGEVALRWQGGEAEATVLSMGNPQACVFVDAFPSDWESIGAAIESHPHFPRRTNVEFIRVLDRHRLEVRIFERGVGPTSSSGTGACAAAVAAIHRDRADSPLEVATPGGLQVVAWPGDGAPATLRGPARIVAEGLFFYRSAD